MKRKEKEGKGRKMKGVPYSLVVMRFQSGFWCSARSASGGRKHSRELPQHQIGVAILRTCVRMNVGRE